MEPNPTPIEATSGDELEQILVTWGQECVNGFGGELQKRIALAAITEIIEREAALVRARIDDIDYRLQAEISRLKGEK